MVFLVLFIGEMAVKLIAMGFVWERSSYLRDAWNWLDCVVVVTGVLDVTGNDIYMHAYMQTNIYR